MDSTRDYEVIHVSKPQVGPPTVVAVATVRTLKVKIVLKLIPPKKRLSQEGADRGDTDSSVHEALSAALHPNIARLLGMWQLPSGQQCLAMEYGAGGDLLAYIPQGRGLPWPEVVALAMQMLAGLLHMHEMGYVHRDIKCENCVLSEDHTQLKLIDFESACRADDPRARAPHGGTRPYLAPERRKGAQLGPYDAFAADVFAAGVVGHCMLCGRLPWEEAHHSDVRYNVFSTTLTLDVPAKDCEGDTIPSGLVDVLQQMLDPDPEFRCTALQALEQLRALAE